MDKSGYIDALSNEKLRKLNNTARLYGKFGRFIKNENKELYYKALEWAKSHTFFKKPSEQTLRAIKEYRKVHGKN